MADADVLKVAISTLSAIVAIVGVVFVIFLRRSEHNAETATKQIVNFLRDKDLKMISMDGIRRNINERYSDEFLRNLPDYFPDDVRRALLKDSSGRNTVPGLARLTRDDALEE